MQFVDPIEDPKQEVQNEPVETPKTEPKPIKQELDYFPIEDLPSKYKFYPEGTQILGRRSLTVSEVKKLSYINESNVEHIINTVVSGAIKGIRFEDLLDDDKMYVIFWLRSNTYCEPGYSVPFYCQSCNSESTYDFDLDNLQIKYVSDEYQSSVKLTNGDELEFRPVTVKGKQSIEKFIKNQQTQFNQNISDEDYDFLNIAQQIASVNGEVKPLSVKFAWLKTQLNPMLLSQIQTVIDDNSFGLKSVLQVKCNKCKEDSLAGVTFRGDFFVPKYRPRCNNGG